MTTKRTWWMTAGLIGVLTSSAWAAGPAKPLPESPAAVKRAFGIYQKSYQKHLEGFVANGVVRSTIPRALDYKDHYFTKETVLDRMANATSRADLVAEFRAANEKALTEEAVQSFEKPGFLSRMAGAPTKPSVNTERLERSVKLFEQDLDEAEGAIRGVDTALAKMPAYLSRGLRITTPYNQPKLATAALRASFLKSLENVSAKFDARPHAGLERLENAIQARITFAIKRDRAAQATHDEQAPDKELHAEARQLIDDINNAPGIVQSHTELMHAEGTSESTTLSRTKTTSPIFLGMGQKTTVTREASMTDVEWQASIEQRAPGAVYRIDLADARLPLANTDFWSNRSAYRGTSMLPVEARLVLEKAIRIGEIYQTLVKRDSPLASRLTDWVATSKFEMRTPVAVKDRSQSTIAWHPAKTVLATSIKKDLAVYSKTGATFIDAERAAMFDEQVKSRMVSDLK